MVKYEKEKNLFINTTFEESNIASNSRTLEGDDKDFFEYDSDSSEEEWNEKFNELERVKEELIKREKEIELFNQRHDILFKKVNETNDEKELEKLETERQEILKEFKELIELVKKQKQLENELDFSDSEEENENKEAISYNKELDKLIEINKKSVINFEGETSKKNLSDFLMPNKDKAGGKKNNALYYMSEEEKDKEAENYKGLDRKLFDKIRERAGKYQQSTGKLVAYQVSQTLINAIPIVGNLAQIPTTVGNYDTMNNFVIEIEKRLTVDEVKEIVREITKEATDTQITTKKSLIRIREMLDEERQKNEEEKTELREKNQELIKKLQKAVEENKNKEREDAEEKARIEKEKGVIQKALQSAEKSEIEQLRAERNQLRTTTEEQETFLNRWIREYERLSLEKKNTILAMEELFLKFKERGRKNTALSADNKGLKEEVKNKEKKIEREQENLRQANEKVHKWIEANGALELKINDLNFQILGLKEQNTKLEGEKQDLQNQLQAVGIPKWFQTTTSFFEMESANQIWGKSVFIGRFALLILAGAILLYIGSWILKVLVAIGRNIKAIFTKKQDTASILKEMLTGMKEAKASVVNKVKRVKKEPTEEVKEVEIIEEKKPVKKEKNKNKQKKAEKRQK